MSNHENQQKISPLSVLEITLSRPIQVLLSIKLQNDITYDIVCKLRGLVPCDRAVDLLILGDGPEHFPVDMPSLEMCGYNPSHGGWPAFGQCRLALTKCIV